MSVDAFPKHNKYCLRSVPVIHLLIRNFTCGKDHSIIRELQNGAFVINTSIQTVHVFVKEKRP